MSSSVPFSLGGSIYAAITLIASCIAIAAAFFSQVIVFRHLRDLS